MSTRTAKRKTDLTAIGVPHSTHGEMKKYADPRGMKLRFLVPLAWEVFKSATPEQIQQASQETLSRTSRAHA